MWSLAHCHSLANAARRLRKVTARHGFVSAIHLSRLTLTRRHARTGSRHTAHVTCKPSASRVSVHLLAHATQYACVQSIGRTSNDAVSGMAGPPSWQMTHSLNCDLYRVQCAGGMFCCATTMQIRFATCQAVPRFLPGRRWARRRSTGCTLADGATPGTSRTGCTLQTARAQARRACQP